MRAQRTGSDPGSESSCLGEELCPAASSPLCPRVPLPWVGTEVELGRCLGCCRVSKAEAPVLYVCFPPGLFIDSASYSAETNPHSSRVPGPAAPASSPSASGSVFWGAPAAPQHHPGICRARGWPGRGDSPQGAGGDTKATPRASQDGLGGSGCRVRGGLAGVRGWAPSCPPSQPPAPLTATPGASARRQAESIFIPCLKISPSGSLAHDGSSLLRLPSGSSQLRDKEQSPASCETPPHPSHPVKPLRRHRSPHAGGAQKYPCAPGAGV